MLRRKSDRCRMSGFLESCIKGFIGDGKYADEIIRRFKDANITNVEDVIEAPEDMIEDLTFLSKEEIGQLKEAVARGAVERFLGTYRDDVYLEYRERLDMARGTISKLEVKIRRLKEGLRKCQKANYTMNDVLNKMKIDVKEAEKDGGVPRVTGWMKLKHYYLGRYRWQIVFGVLGLLLLLVLLFLF